LLLQALLYDKIKLDIIAQRLGARGDKMGLFNIIKKLFSSDQEKQEVKQQPKPQKEEKAELSVDKITEAAADSKAEQAGKQGQDEEQVVQHEKSAKEIDTKTENYAEDLFLEGMAYFNGTGVDQNDVKARKLFAQAQQQGSVRGKVMLGVCYMLGRGIAQNKAVARSLFNEASEAGDTTGMRFLANAILESEPKPEDLEKAINLYEKAAELKDPEACDWLGDRYYKGEGRPHNVGKALELYKMAAAFGHNDAEYKLCLHVLQTEDNENLPWAVEVLQGLVKDEYPQAFYALGTLYYTGTGVEENFEEGAKLIKQAAELGDPRAQDLFGRWCYDGELYKPDYTSALHWFEEAAKQNYAPAQVNLGKMYLLGQGVDQNIFEAAQLFYQAGMQGNVEGMQCLMNTYRVYYVPAYGDGNDGRDVAWLQRAASFCFQEPLYKLGSMLVEGQGVVQYVDKGMEMLMVSAILGFGPAMYKAGIILLEGKLVPKDAEQAMTYIELAAKPDLEGNVVPEAELLIKKLNFKR